mgnify:CR=1 FL=1
MNDREAFCMRRFTPKSIEHEERESWVLPDLVVAMVKIAGILLLWGDLTITT